MQQASTDGAALVMNVRGAVMGRRSAGSWRNPSDAVVAAMPVWWPRSSVGVPPRSSCQVMQRSR
jgi:hypothetical protein